MMIPAADPQRHAPVDVLEAYREQGTPGVLQVEGSPSSRIRIAPAERQLTLLVVATGNTEGPDLRALANLDYTVQEEAGVMWHRLDVAYGENLTEIYPVLCSIADRVQLHGEAFSDAVSSALEGLGNILAGRGGLSREQQVGLFGELLAVQALAVARTPVEALTAWRGPDREEHDLALTDADVEVKTTLSEGRTHWIGSLTQLVPTPGRDLYLLSVQLTAAGAGAGRSLGELVAAVRSLPGVQIQLEAALLAAGWQDRHYDLYPSRWTLRSAPHFYIVGSAFPALTPDLVASAVPEPGRVLDVRYRIDLQGLQSNPDLFPVTSPGAPAV